MEKLSTVLKSGGSAEEVRVRVLAWAESAAAEVSRRLSYPVVSYSLRDARFASSEIAGAAELPRGEALVILSPDPAAVELAAVVYMYATGRGSKAVYLRAALAKNPA